MKKAKFLLLQCGVFYFAGLLLILGMKLFYSNAGSQELDWILAPIAKWVGVLCGESFEKQPYTGYINHHFQFIIAPSCSGIQFMMITFATLVYSFIHYMRTTKGRFYWLLFSAAASYCYTVFVNGIRIVVAIYLPLYLRTKQISSEWLTDGMRHTIEGTAIYFISLILIYGIAHFISREISGGSIKRKIAGDTAIFHHRKLFKWTPPIFWYFSITLGIPLLNRATHKNSGQFIAYALLMTAVCVIIVMLLCLGTVMHIYLGKIGKSDIE